jgi:hypothetical protein
MFIVTMAKKQGGHANVAAPRFSGGNGRQKATAIQIFIR